MSRLHSFLSSCMRTRYEVDVPDLGSVALAIGQPSAAIDDVLRRYGADTYAYLTAYNPQSTTLSDAENRRRHEELCRVLSEAGYAYLTARPCRRAMPGSPRPVCSSPG